MRREGGGRGGGRRERGRREGGEERGGGRRRKLRADGKCVFVSNVDNLSSDNTCHATLI